MNSDRFKPTPMLRQLFELPIAFQIVIWKAAMGSLPRNQG